MTQKDKRWSKVTEEEEGKIKKQGMRILGECLTCGRNRRDRVTGFLVIQRIQCD